MPGSDFFFCKRGLPSPNISANHMARILSTSYVHVHVHTRTVNVCAMLMISYVILKYAPYDWLKCNPRLQKKNSLPGRTITQRRTDCMAYHFVNGWGNPSKALTILIISRNIKDYSLTYKLLSLIANILEIFMSQVLSF